MFSNSGKIIGGVVLVMVGLCVARTTDSTFLYVRGTNVRTNASVEVCANFQVGSWLSDSVKSAVSYPLAFWPNEDDYWCTVPPGLSMASVVTYGLYYPPVGNRCAVGKTSTVGDSLDNLKAAGGRVALLLRDELPYWFYSTIVNVSRLGGSVFYIDSENFNSIQRLYGGNRSQAGDVRLQFYRPPEPAVKLSVMLFLLIPTLCIMIGGLCAGKSHQALIGQTSVHKLHGDAGEQDSVEGGRSAKAARSLPAEPATVPFNCVIVCIFVIISAVTLVILFFFYNRVVVIILVFYLFGATNAVYGILLALIPCGRWLDFGLALPAFVNLCCCCCCKSERHKTRHVYPLRVALYLLSSSLPLAWYFCRKKWFSFILQDVIGILLSISVIRMLRMPSLKWLTAFLGAFLIYDVFMVFVSPLLTKGCSIMLYVAMGGGCNDAVRDYDTVEEREKLPLSLLFPRIDEMILKCTKPHTVDSIPTMLLGLGDVILPGTVVAYNCAVDLNWKTPYMIYYVTSVVMYTIGTYAGLMVVIFAGQAQPALIYLVPAVLIPTHLLGLIRGEWKKLWNGSFVTSMVQEEHRPIGDPSDEP